MQSDVPDHGVVQRANRINEASTGIHAFADAFRGAARHVREEDGKQEICFDAIPLLLRRGVDYRSSCQQSFSLEQHYYGFAVATSTSSA